MNKPFSFKVFPFVSTVSFLPHYIGPFSSYEATCSQLCFQKLFLNEINFFPFCNLKSCLLEALIHALLSHCTLSPWMLISKPVVSISPCICLDLFLGCAHPAWNLLQIPHLANLQSTFSLQASQRHLQCHLSQTQVIIFPDSTPPPKCKSATYTGGLLSDITWYHIVKDKISPLSKATHAKNYTISMQTLQGICWAGQKLCLCFFMWGLTRTNILANPKCF